MGAQIRLPLRVLLPCITVSLVAFGAVAVGTAMVSGTGSYLIRQADDDLSACASGMLSHRLVAAPASSQVPPGACEMELLSAGGQVLTLAAPGTARGPGIPSGGSWLAAHLGRPVTVPGAGTSGRWRILIVAVHYQPQRILYVYGPDDVKYVISGRLEHGSRGMLVVMAGLAGTARITGRLAAGFAAAAGTVLVLLAGATLVLTQAILRPLRQAAGLAESAAQAAAGGLPRVGGEGNCWPFGMTLTRMPEQLGASRTAEAAARRSADEMSEHLGETALELLRSVSIVRGFAEYYRQQPKPPAAQLDRMLRRAADEAARMETLIAGLGALSPRGSRCPCLGPGQDGGCLLRPGRPGICAVAGEVGWCARGFFLVDEGPA